MNKNSNNSLWNIFSFLLGTYNSVSYKNSKFEPFLYSMKLWSIKLAVRLRSAYHKRTMDIIEPGFIAL